MCRGFDSPLGHHFSDLTDNAKLSVLFLPILPNKDVLKKRYLCSCHMASGISFLQRGASLFSYCRCYDDAKQNASKSIENACGALRKIELFKNIMIMSDMRKNDGYLTWYQGLRLWFRDNWYHFLIAFLMCAAILIVDCALYGWTALINYANGLFIGGAVSILIGLLFVVTLFGGTDIFTFYLLRERTASGKEDLYQYSKRKKTQRMKNPYSFVPYIIIGAFAIIAAVIIIVTL